MGRGRDFRGGGKGRRPYEEDAVASAAASDRHQSRPLPRESLPTEGTAVDAIVKWFNPDKGFGFAELLMALAMRSCTSKQFRLSGKKPFRLAPS